MMNITQVWVTNKVVEGEGGVYYFIFFVFLIMVAEKWREDRNMIASFIDLENAYE